MAFPPKEDVEKLYGRRKYVPEPRGDEALRRGGRFWSRYDNSTLSIGGPDEPVVHRPIKRHIEEPRPHRNDSVIEKQQPSHNRFLVEPPTDILRRTKKACPSRVQHASGSLNTTMVDLADQTHTQSGFLARRREARLEYHRKVLQGAIFGRAAPTAPSRRLFPEKLADDHIRSPAETLSTSCNPAPPTGRVHRAGGEPATTVAAATGRLRAHAATGVCSEEGCGSGGFAATEANHRGRGPGRGVVLEVTSRDGARRVTVARQDQLTSSQRAAAKIFQSAADAMTTCAADDMGSAAAVSALRRDLGRSTAPRMRSKNTRIDDAMQGEERAFEKTDTSDTKVWKYEPPRFASIEGSLIAAEAVDEGKRGGPFNFQRKGTGFRRPSAPGLVYGSETWDALQARSGNSEAGSDPEPSSRRTGRRRFVDDSPSEARVAGLLQGSGGAVEFAPADSRNGTLRGNLSGPRPSGWRRAGRRTDSATSSIRGGDGESDARSSDIRTPRRQNMAREPGGGAFKIPLRAPVRSSAGTMKYIDAYSVDNHRSMPAVVRAQKVPVLGLNASVLGSLDTKALTPDYNTTVSAARGSSHDVRGESNDRSDTTQLPCSTRPNRNETPAGTPTRAVNDPISNGNSRRRNAWGVISSPAPRDRASSVPTDPVTHFAPAVARSAAFDPREKASADVGKVAQPPKGRRRVASIASTGVPSMQTALRFDGLNSPSTPRDRTRSAAIGNTSLCPAWFAGGCAEDRSDQTSVGEHSTASQRVIHRESLPRCLGGPGIRSDSPEPAARTPRRGGLSNVESPGGRLCWRAGPRD